MRLEEIVPWGRSRAEYVRMFVLTSRDLNGTILDCASGPASFNAEATEDGGEVTSCDPIYRFTAREIKTRIEEVYGTMISNAEATKDEFVWDEIESPEHLGRIRMEAMRRFLDDFPTGLEEGRYTTEALPYLGFEDELFDLALCSSFLFTYSDQLSLDFHISAIEEMCRVAREARIFPLFKSYGGPSPLVSPVMDALSERGYRVTKRRVPYEFQRGGNEMLSVLKS